MNFNKIKLYVQNTFSLINQDDLINKLFLLKKQILLLKKKKNKLIIIGNGGSCSTASHVSVDLTKNAKVTAINFNEADLVTCFANDYGFENIFEKALSFYANKGDMVLVLSVSGNSKNLVNAIKYCYENQLSVVTFSGTTKTNKIYSLNKKGLNFFIDSSCYNQVEIAHHFLLLTLVDIIIGKFNYGTNL